MVPILVLCGQAGSGKDTVGNYLAYNHGAQCIALADPIKRICQYFFEFTDEQLWGPSEFRGKIDDRYTGVENQEKIRALISKKLGTPQIDIRLLDVIPDNNLDYAYSELDKWAFDCRLKAREGLTPRYCLQTLGTEWGRLIDPDLWVEIGIETAFQLLENPDLCYKPQTGLKQKEKADLKWGPTGIVITDGRFRNEILGVLKVGGKSLKIDRPIASVSSTHQSETEVTQIPLNFFDYILHNDGSMKNLQIKADSIIERAWKRGEDL
jgi:hypothetical protein